MFKRKLWVRSLENIAGGPELTLVENESGFATFRTHRPPGKEIPILCGESRRRFSVTVAEYAARQNVAQTDSAIDTATLSYTVHPADGEPMKFYQPLIVL